MRTLRVSASDIDAYRRFRDNDDVELADLLAQLRRESAPTPAMMAGTALHAALETIENGDYQSIAIEDYQFDFETDAEIDVPPVREMKVTGQFVIGDVLVTLVGKVDAVHGKRVDDHKLTARFDPERFMNSYQWRVYLMLFRADEFRWNVFEAKEITETHYAITAVHPLTMHRYPGMEDDVMRELDLFVGLAQAHLPEKIRSMAA